MCQLPNLDSQKMRKSVMVPQRIRLGFHCLSLSCPRARTYKCFPLESNSDTRPLPSLSRPHLICKLPGTGAQGLPLPIPEMSPLAVLCPFLWPSSTYNPHLKTFQSLLGPPGPLSRKSLPQMFLPHSTLFSSFLLKVEMKSHNLPLDYCLSFPSKSKSQPPINDPSSL
jgi:hypothetical protein